MSMCGIEWRGAAVANVRGGLHRAGWIAPSGLGWFVGVIPPPRALPWTQGVALDPGRCPGLP
jgi:hypothetical protein